MFDYSISDKNLLKAYENELQYFTKNSLKNFNENDINNAFNAIAELYMDDFMDCLIAYMKEHFYNSELEEIRKKVLTSK